MKTFNLNTEESKRLHQPFVPNDIRPGELVSARIVCEQPRFERELQVWRQSPLGIEIVMGSDEGLLEKGLAIDLELKIGKQVAEFRGLVVDSLFQERGRTLVGIRLVAPPKQRVAGEERRKSRRWICSSNFSPTAMALNPGKFNDFLYFKVKDLSSSGMLLTTSLRNSELVAGIKLTCIVSFPLVSQSSIDVVIKNVRIIVDDGREQLALGVEFRNASHNLKEAIGQYLLQYGSADSLEVLKQEGLIASSPARSVTYSFVRTEEDYREVLKLRRRAYVASGKAANDIPENHFADVYDTRARIVIGRYFGKAVATASLVFHEADDKMEHEEYAQLPPTFPRRDETIEIMRTCTDPGFRGGDILVSMFQFLALATVQSGREWSVISATPEVLPLYERIGYKRTGIRYKHEKLNNLEHEVLLGNVPKAMCGIGVGPLYWNIVWGHVSKYMDSYDMLNLDPARKLRMGAYKLLSPVAFFLKRRTNKPRKKSEDRMQLAAGKQSA